MTQVIQDELKDVASYVLESIVFAFAEPLDSIPSFDDACYLMAEVGYSGSCSGLLSMVAPESLCQEWAEMMSSNRTSAIAYDTLAELSNIIAGHWISRHFCHGEDVKLNPPRVSKVNESDWNTLVSDLLLTQISIDGSAVLLRVTAQG